MENTETQNIAPKGNPLSKFFRQPKLYIKLPSSGNFYPNGSLERTENNEYPVYAMTAKDEIALKTPDALLNGQSTVDVIQSCMPNIKNAWHVPTIDIDAILIAIRIATYGEALDVDVRIPNTEIIKTYSTDLRIALDNVSRSAFDGEIDLDEGLKVFLKPLDYAKFTSNSIKTLEEQRIFQVVNSASLSEEEKIDQFNKSFSKITDITMSVVSESIYKIVTDEGEVTEPHFINEFVANSDKKYYEIITKHIEEQKTKFSMPLFKVETTDEERSDGAPESFETPVVLDASNFFV
jgi:hypothetical protein